MSLDKLELYLNSVISQDRVEKHHYFKEALQLYLLEFIRNDRELTENIVFQGGTALRLCYGLQRLSEYLDFVAGEKFVESGEKLKRLIVENIPELAIKEKKTEYLYTIILKTPEGISLKLEIARVPSYKNTFKRVTSDLFSYNPSIWLKVETLEEIFADKVVAMGLRRVIREMPFKSRDVWDIYWLMNKRIDLDISIVIRKIKDYGKSIDEFLSNLNYRLEITEKEKPIEFFTEEMKKFLYGKEAEAFFLYPDEIAKAVIDEVTRNLKNLSKDFTERLPADGMNP